MKINLTRKARVTGVALAALAVFLGTGANSCSGSSTSTGQSSENATSNSDLYTFQQAQPAPHFPYSVLRQSMIEVEASQALGEQTTTFFFEPGGGDPDPINSCPSIGDPIPNTAELTNPQKVQTYYNNGVGAVAIGNIDPNGIYPPASSSGTNVMCVNAQGVQYLVYWEGFVYTVNGAARWDSATHQIVVTGQPQMPKCKVGSVLLHNKKVRVNLCTK